MAVSGQRWRAPWCLVNFSIRYSLAPLTSVFAAMEMGYTEAQKAYLLGAFFP